MMLELLFGLKLLVYLSISTSCVVNEKRLHVSLIENITAVVFTLE